MLGFKIVSKAQKELIDRELNIYRQERLVEIEKEYEEKRRRFQQNLEQLALKCAQDKGNYEHEFHFAMETLKVEIAKLEEKKERIKEVIEKDQDLYMMLMEAKRVEIERLDKLVTELLKKIPQNIAVTSVSK